MHTKVSLRAFAVVLASLVVVPSLTARQQPETSLPGVRNYTPVDATVACSGAVTPEAVAALKQAGFASMVNLRTAEEEGAGLAETREAAEEAGLRYFHIPFSSSHPEPGPVDRFLDAARDERNEPMLISCATGGRASMMLLIKRVMLDGWSVERAMAEVPSLTGQMKPVLRAFSLDYLKQHHHS